MSTTSLPPDVDPHTAPVPSDWVRRWSHLVRPQGTVLDVACGSGRHMRWFSELGHTVTGVDRSPEAIQQAARYGEALLADIEGEPWPLAAQGQVRSFDAVVVTNYLWRELFPTVLRSVAPGGVLLYETFAAGNETVGRPSRPDFLLRPGELLRLCGDLHVVAYEDGFLDQPARFVQRIVAVRETPGTSGPKRYPLDAVTTAVTG